MRRVVVTGLGLVSPLGNTVSESWSALLAGKSGIAPITSFDATPFNCRIAAKVKGFDATKALGIKDGRRFEPLRLTAYRPPWKRLTMQGLRFATRIRLAIEPEPSSDRESAALQLSVGIMRPF